MGVTAIRCWWGNHWVDIVIRIVGSTARAFTVCDMFHYCPALCSLYQSGESVGHYLYMVGHDVTAAFSIVFDTGDLSGSAVFIYS